MSHLLFVDDDQDLLQGLRNTLRRRRHEWIMTFVSSGHEALRVLEEQPCDILVTDLRMPQMDGAQLLALLSDRFPCVSRMVLTGHAGRETLVRAHTLAHQILTKPCSSTDLQTAIERLLMARERASNQQVQVIVGRVTSLPAVKWVHRELMEAFQTEHCRIDELAAIVERDPGLAAKVLQLANSACFGGHMRLHSVLAAMRYIGLEQLAALIMMAQTFQLMEGHARPHPFDPASWQVHSLACASLARLLCWEPARADDAYLAGLLHDVGQVVFRLACAGEWAEILQRQAAGEWSVQDGERSLLGVGHAEVGAHLLACWGFEPAVVAAVARHHGHAGPTGEAAPTAGVQAVIRATREAQAIMEDIDQLPKDDAALRAWLCARTSPATQDAGRLDEVVAHLRQWATMA